MIKSTLHFANNTDFMAGLPDSSIDLTVTSPPYDSLRSYKQLGDWGWQQFVSVSAQLARITCPGGVIVWNVGDSTINGSETGNSFRQALHFIDVLGLKLHDTMIWQKSNFSNPSKNRYHQTFEYVFIISKGTPNTFNPIKDRPNVYAGQPGSRGKNTVTQVDGSKKIRTRKINTEFGMRHNVWVTKTAGQDQTSKKFQHPAMFSEEFARDHILSWSNPGDIVFDPFVGSGTTVVVAEALGRIGIGVDISEEYINIAKKRLTALAL